VTGIDLQIVSPTAPEALGPGIELAPTLHTNARTDRELLDVWLRGYRDGSPHTVRAYARLGARFIDGLAAGAGLRSATLDDLQSALEQMRVQIDGTPARAATVMTYVAAVKSFIGFAHRVGYTRFNAAPLIRVKKAPRQIAQHLLCEFDVGTLIRAAQIGRDRVLLEAVRNQRRAARRHRRRTAACKA
jgi:site-specific recombinase XerD